MGKHVFIHHGHAEPVPRQFTASTTSTLTMSWATHGQRGGRGQRGMQDRRQKADSRQGGDFVCPAARNTRIEQTGKSSCTFSAYSEIMGGPLLGGTALNGGAHWGTLWLPLAQGTGPRRRGALSVRGAPPPSPQKSPASVLARLGRCQWKGNESTYLRRPFFQSSSFQFPSPFSSTPSPSRVCFVREARCRSFALLGVQFNFLPWVVCLLKFCGLCLVQ